MNKTVNVNLGGVFFYIDEDAYLKLSHYFDAIKKSLSNSFGQEEIIKDIEMRVAELLSEKQNSDKHVVSIKEVEEVIVIMGQPEDYKIDDEKNDNSSTNYSNSGAKLKKIYRDKDHETIAGVCSGLGHYFGIDVTWIRIAFLIMAFAWGFGFTIYFILWIATPQAKTTSEKLEMTGEPVTISNIEKKVREEFENVSQKVKNANYDAMGNKVKSGAERFSSSLGDIILNIFKIFAKMIGGIILFVSSSLFIALFISLFAIGTSNNIHAPWIDYFKTFNYTDTSMILIWLILFVTIGIPVFFFLLLGLKILFSKLKPIGNIAKYTLIAFWVLAFVAMFTLIFQQTRELAFEGKVVKKEVISLNPSDTLFVKMKFNNYFTKNINEREDFKLVQDSTNHELIYSNQIEFRILRTDEKQPYIQIEKNANGSSFMEAKNRAEKIEYHFKIEGNHLILDNYLLTDARNKFRDQNVQIFLYLPKGTLLKPDTNLKEYDESDNYYFNLHHSSNKFVYSVGSDKILCLNCPSDENEYDDIINEDDKNDSNSTTVIVNKNGIIINNDTIKERDKKNHELKINKNGIIIKSN